MSGLAVSLSMIAFFCLADASVVAADSFFDGLLKTYGPIGALVWYLWHTTSVSFPRISKEHLAQMELICEKHDKTVSTIVAEFRDEMAEQRKRCQEELEMLREAYTRGGTSLE